MEQIFRWMQNRIYKQNKNNLVIVTGETGSGKSERALHCAERLCPSFNPETHIIFKAIDLFNLLAEGKVKKGDVIIWEEGGVEANNRNWYTMQNKLINFAFQTMRDRNFTLIMTVPSLSFIDAGLRHLFHLYIECRYIDYKRNLCRCKVKRLQHNPEEGVTYKKYFRMMANGEPIIATNIWIGRPSPELLEKYLPMKKKYTDALYTQCAADMNAETEKAKKDYSKPKDYGVEIELAKTIIPELMYNGSISLGKIKNRFKVSNAGAQVIKENLA